MSSLQKRKYKEHLKICLASVIVEEKQVEYKEELNKY
jgi:hypothetical protein